MSESKYEDLDTEEAKTDYQQALLKRAMSYCWSEAFLGRFRRFFSENAGVFEDHAREHMNFTKTEDCSTPTVEHDLNHHKCFAEYLEMFESTLEAFVEEEGSTSADFFQQLSDCKENPRITPEENLFIQCLLASADYESFYSVMIKEAKKLIVMKNAGKIYDGPTEIASPTAEGKEGDLDDFEDLGIDDGESKDARK
ncbi:hypothetical protein TrST_g4141 [Triparma strigata]|uniref:Cilia- and flagella-associated protein 36 n=1 Tax=Triparma strigata TaxID=1606541 RepID=A0A9W6ZUR3_9STRA|nr:hypothetical protein TrST_g4141 [Triparma strigata]|eukprot:CAMPEP_0182490636 /NCGR_PEP_ID=MMETSP1321-20130603/426_1 /TAXON_ID=91990 /ORGANISM="Bolidomonas sp., Strain RCC1657" /LENGTH=196 /DNA_ID=CAMNT_0024692853 /DNA_START=59 /DNA_END=649 /DNA_ORIENTATION=+